ncbi:MAG: pyridoxamine 5'-phosphate oxidase family protein [Planctomycetes bacterium]|nr:pyridoxamine 5'-phosphate oxidase family protein [Planctomycetota bacterium]MBL7185073.1 pyridoxamine 5'-phosphate oxidase family protein [Phycisphaerae bacterium]
MSLSDYFDNVQGLGILATADSDGMVDLAIYARPHVIDEITIAFVMRERLSHQNLKSNPNAAYMFVEQGEGYVGKRLYLTKTREETNTSLIEEFRRRQPEICAADDDSNKYLVFLQINDVWPLVGDKE